MGFSELLAQSMRDSGLTESDLAELTGLRRLDVHAWIMGQRRPPDEAIHRMALVLDCPELELAPEEVKAPAPKPPNTMSVKECAKALGASEQFVRVALQSGAAPFGFAVKRKRWSYFISRKKVEEYVGGMEK